MNFQELIQQELAKQVAEGRITVAEAERRLQSSTTSTVVDTSSENLQAKASSGLK